MKKHQKQPRRAPAPLDHNRLAVLLCQELIRRITETVDEAFQRIYLRCTTDAKTHGAERERLERDNTALRVEREQWRSYVPGAAERLAGLIDALEKRLRLKRRTRRNDE